MAEEERRDDSSTTMVFAKLGFEAKHLLRMQEILALFAGNMKHVMKKTSNQLEKVVPLVLERFRHVQ
eukprot:2827171-Amphidinium_carterae.1